MSPAKRQFPIVRCPGCNTDMEVTGTEPAPSGQTRITYRCAECGAETERLAKIEPEK